MIKGIICLIFFYALGEGITLLTNLPIPGAVIGMLLLFFLLRYRGQSTPTWLNDSSQLFIRFLPLFFLPAAVGIFFLPDAFHTQWPAFLGAIVIATLISLATTALVMKELLKKADKSQPLP